jgi:virginiamycin B lyase
VNVTTLATTDFTIPTAGSGPNIITPGPDGNLWFTEDIGNGAIGRFDPMTQMFAEFPIQTHMSFPIGIATGPDGNLWFTEDLGNKIGRITTTGTIMEFSIPTQASAPNSIATGPDGNVWFTENSNEANKIGRITPTGSITEFPIPTFNSGPTGIIAGPDGNLWFTESSGNRIGRITPTGTITEFPIPTPNALPTRITLGPDGNLWFNEVSAQNIGEVVFTHAPPTAPDLAVSGTAPASVSVGNHVGYMLTVKNNGTASATGVMLTDTLPAGVSFISASGGVAPVNGVVTFTIGTLAAGSSASFAVIVTPTGAGMLTNAAAASMDQTDPTPADNSITLPTNVIPVSVDGPTVTQVQRFGIHAQPTSLVLTFDEPLDPARAQDVRNYQIVDLAAPHRSIRITVAVYDQATQSVTLSPAQRLNFHHRFLLAVIGTGPNAVADTLGHLLDGAKTGRPGSNFATLVTAANLVRIDPRRSSSHKSSRSGRK